MSTKSLELQEWLSYDDRTRTACMKQVIAHCGECINLNNYDHSQNEEWFTKLPDDAQQMILNAVSKGKRKSEFQRIETIVDSVDPQIETMINTYHN